MPRTKPKPFQIAGVKALEAADGRTLLADDMGLGKTFQALHYLRRNPPWPGVAVVPASVKYTWEAEAMAHLGWASYVCEGRRPPATPPLHPPHLFIVNYDIVRYWADWLRGLRPGCVILDECQNVANQSTQRARGVRALCQHVPHVLGLSGTPLLNRPTELWTVLNILWPHKYESFFHFACQYARPTRRYGRWHYGGARNLPQLHTELKANGMVRRLKEDVLPELPPLTRQVVPLAIKRPHEYQLAAKDFRSWIKLHKPTKAKRALRAEGLARVGYLLRLAAQLKTKAVGDWLDTWLAGGTEKVVVFCHHLGMLHALHNHYHKSAVCIHGGISARLRKVAVDQFQHDPKKRVFIGNKAALVGLTLTAASTTVHTEMYWRPADHTQGEARVHRISQGRPCWAYYLVGRDTIEQDVCAVVQEKQGTIQAVLDGGGGAEFDIFDMLMERLRQKGLVA